MKTYLVEFDFGLRDAFGKSLEVLTENDMEVLKSFIESGEDVYLGEIEGKHSEVCGPVENHDYKILTSDESKIEVFIELFDGWFGAYSMMGAIYESLEEIKNG